MYCVPKHIFRQIADYEMTLTNKISDGQLQAIFKALTLGNYDRTAHQIEGYTNCAFLETLSKRYNDHLSHLERHVAEKVKCKFKHLSYTY